MNKPTFKAIEHKVDLALCLIAVLIALGFAFSNDATAKSMADDKAIKHISKSLLVAQRKVEVGAQHKSKSNANSANLDIGRTNKPNKTNVMPVIDEINPAFKKSRLI